MTLRSTAAMVLFYDIDGDSADHDDWHSYEHFHERLSVPGFLRATRWVALEGTPKYMVTYEVSGVDVATSEGYLDRLNNPTSWTSEMMPRFRGMTRGFCHIMASSGFGLGNIAVALRFVPEEGSAERLSGWIADHILPAMVSRRGMVGAHLLQPAPPPPMTREQSLRGRDNAMPWLIFATAYDAAAGTRAASKHLCSDALRDKGASADITLDTYALHYTATAEEVARTPPPPALGPDRRRSDGPHL
jgi:hypothetical protein